MTRGGSQLSVKTALRLIILTSVGFFLLINTAFAGQVSLLPTLSATVSDSVYSLCNQTYAQCTTALCMPVPGEPTQALCFCKVMQGNSLGALSCDERKPRTNNYGNKVIIASFSLMPHEHEVVKQALTCPAGHAWAYCLDKTCYINSHDATKATCNCTLQHSGSYVTEGAHCDSRMCSRDLLSATAVDESMALITTYLQKIKSKDTAKDVMCPISDDVSEKAPHEPAVNKVHILPKS